MNNVTSTTTTPPQIVNDVVSQLEEVEKRILAMKNLVDDVLKYEMRNFDDVLKEKEKPSSTKFKISVSALRHSV